MPPKSKFSLNSLIFSAPVLILVLDLSIQIFSAFSAIENNTATPFTLRSEQVKLVRNSPNGLMSFGNNNDITDKEDIVVTISVDKLNVFYAGLANPITIGTNIPRENISVSIAEGAGGTVRKSGKTTYIVQAFRLGDLIVNVTNKTTGKIYPFKFRVKRIPDPIARLGKQTDGLMKAGEFRAQVGLVVWLDNFDFDAKCTIQSFVLYHTTKGQTPVEMLQKGGRFTGTVASAIQAAQAGDQYAFTNVKARCPGDFFGRKINALSFQIK